MTSAVKFLVCVLPLGAGGGGGVGQVQAISTQKTSPPGQYRPRKPWCPHTFQCARLLAFLSAQAGLTTFLQLKG